MRPTVPHVLYVPEHVSSAWPRSLGEYWDEVFCSWQPTGCKNSSICSLWVGNHWDDSVWVVGVARATFGRRLSYGAALPLLFPIFLYSRMASFKEKVHHFNWIFSILRGVKLNILLGLFTHTLESSKCDIWEELHDFDLKWEQSSSCASSCFLPADFERGKRLQNLNTHWSSRKPRQWAPALTFLAFCWLIVCPFHLLVPG